jgi:hypothetical protein
MAFVIGTYVVYNGVQGLIQGQHSPSAYIVLLPDGVRAVIDETLLKPFTTVHDLGLGNPKRIVKFRIVIESDESLTVNEIWPDGDAPANPTVADVAARIKADGGPYDVLRSWNLPLTLDVTKEE